MIVPRPTEQKLKATLKNQFGLPIPINISIEDGSWEKVSNGRVWRIVIQAEGASTVNLLIKGLHLPKGSYFVVINKEADLVIGPLYNDDVVDGNFFTDIIKGDQLSVELFEPLDYSGLAKIGEPL